MIPSLLKDILALDHEKGTIGVLDDMATFLKGRYAIEEGNLSLDKLDIYLSSLDRDNATELASFILRECEARGNLRQLLDLAYQLSSSSFLFAFLLTLARTNTPQINGLATISSLLGVTQHKKGELRTSRSRSKTLLSATFTELKEKLDIAAKMKEESINKRDYDQIAFFANEMDALEKEIALVQDTLLPSQNTNFFRWKPSLIGKKSNNNSNQIIAFNRNPILHLQDEDKK
jgi:hypothetical protein